MTGRHLAPRVTRHKLGSRQLRIPRGSLAVTCWCEAEFVAVPERDVFNGRTRACRRAACKAIEKALLDG